MRTPIPVTQVVEEDPTATDEAMKEYPHYYKEVPSGVSHLDVYAVLRMWEVHDPAIAHAVKKLLCSGARGAKDKLVDMKEAVVSINRAIDMHHEFGDGEPE